MPSSMPIMHGRKCGPEFQRITNPWFKAWFKNVLKSAVPNHIEFSDRKKVELRRERFDDRFWIFTTEFSIEILFKFYKGQVEISEPFSEPILLLRYLTDI